MTALDLNPYDNNYLSCKLINQQLADNKLDLELAASVSNNSVEQIGRIVLDGTGRASLEGQLFIGAASPGANYPICSLPAKLTPTKDFYFPVCVLRNNAYVTNAVTIQSGGSGISGVTDIVAGSYATMPTFTVVGDGVGASLTPIMKVVTIGVATAQSGAGSYAPNETVALANGTFSTRAVGTIASTKVVSGTVAAGGSGGVDGVQTVTGTTGTGTKFQALVTVSGGSITAVNSISVAGNYTVNPTSLTNEPVTGGSVTGGQLSVKMGINTINPTTVGSYTALPSDPVAQFSTSGSGTGATFTVLWGVLGATVVSAGEGYSADNTTIEVTGGGGSGGGSVTPTLAAEESAQVILVNAPTQNDVVCLDGISFLVEPYH